jgi:hypothetical protein
MTALMSWDCRPRTSISATRTSKLEVVTGQTVPDIEVVADDGKPHRVGAKQKAPVFNSVKVTYVERNFYCAATVPADMVA